MMKRHFSGNASCGDGGLMAGEFILPEDHNPKAE